MRALVLCFLMVACEADDGGSEPSGTGGHDPGGGGTGGGGGSSGECFTPENPEPALTPGATGCACDNDKSHCVVVNTTAGTELVSMECSAASSTWIVPAYGFCESACGIGQRGTECGKCGPADACEITESSCLLECSAGTTCADGRLCVDGFCRYVCG
jgi:hypothetical protein